MLFTLLSAVMYVLPFFYPQLSFTLLFFLIPIVYQSYYQGLMAFHGLVWGIIVLTLHTSWFSFLLFFESTRSLRIMVILLTISWFSMPSIIWFFLTERLKSLFDRQDFALILSWLTTTTIYFLYITKWSLFLLGRIEGYVFFNPFIPLAHYPHLLWPLKHLGFFACLMLLVLIQIFLVLGLVNNGRYLLVSTFMITVLIAGGFWYVPKQAIMTEACFIRPWWHKSKDAVFAGHRMIHDVSKALYNNDNVKVVVLPESSFPWDIDGHPYLLDALCDYPEAFILFGGQRKIENRYTNSCFATFGGKVVFSYDKIHLMPLVERDDALFKFLSISNLFSDGEYFSYPEQQQKDLLMVNGKEYQVFLCSELYFEAKPIKGVPILFLGNDDWFYCDYAKKLSELFMTYFQACYNVPILYCTTGGYSNITKVAL